VTAAGAQSPATDRGEWFPLLPGAEVAPASDVVGAFARGQELVVWRAADGTPQVWENRCPHRSVRLTLGQVVDNRLSCAYHGWSYAADSARCERIPAHPDRTPPANLCARTFTCAERDGTVWAWLGADAPAAEPPAHPLPPGWAPLRTLSLRCSAPMARLALAALGWRHEGGALWSGRLGDQPAQALLLEAQSELAMLHLRCGAPGALRDVHALARQLRADIESQAGAAAPATEVSS